ncbi:hypothetical protein [Pseudoxanthomonas sp.]|uniref:hypothetical protein n=1 Tax=Pseudoxanthomonas sp. TaxID=1871049 RepID=UPI00260269B5|nr:hypothetical protein [Pseudoxanthomonas sp.]WDS36049.1 MAG: hypothetical protein O8I58_17425 [Pseudoxanthomonas sp.]
MNSHKKFNKAPGFVRHNFLAVVVFVMLTGGVVAPALADWQVDDDKTQQEIDKMKTKLDERLKQIYEQSYVQTGDGKVFNVDEKKTKSLQYEESQSGNAGGISGKLEAWDIDALAAARCPDDSKNPSNSKQQPICIDILKHEGKLFSYLLDMLELNKQRQEQLKTIIDDRKSLQEIDYGKIQSNTNRLLAFQAQQQIDAANLSLTINSYDRYLSNQRARLADITRNMQRGTGEKDQTALGSFLGDLLGQDNPLVGAAEGVASTAGPLLVLKGALKTAKHYD